MNMQTLKTEDQTIELPDIKNEPVVNRSAWGNGHKIVILDDDPTGCQTIHNIPVLLTWDDVTIRKTLQDHDVFFILHNSRSMPDEEARKVNEDIVNALLRYVNKSDLTVISRSDSTLRGHFLTESMVLNDLMGPFDGVLLLPFFKEGGRFTINNTHYVQEGEILTPAHETEFARDEVFGFSTAYMPDWVEEKSNGFWKSENVACITLEDIRKGGKDAVKRKLAPLQHFQCAVINAVEYSDLHIVAGALVDLQKEGKRFLSRSAASWVRVMAGQTEHPLYKPDKKMQRGLIVVGSYTQKTSSQLQTLKDAHDVAHIELIIDRILTDFDKYQQECLNHIDQAFNKDGIVVISTERKYKSGEDKAKALHSGSLISKFLSELVNKLDQSPDFVVAKGGITSYDVAKYGLNIRTAEVLGQINPGIPIWKADNNSKYPGLEYVVFPGNVGQQESLRSIYEILTQ